MLTPHDAPSPDYNLQKQIDRLADSHNETQKSVNALTMQIGVLVTTLQDTTDSVKLLLIHNDRNMRIVEELNTIIRIDQIGNPSLITRAEHNTKFIDELDSLVRVDRGDKPSLLTRIRLLEDPVQDHKIKIWSMWQIILAALLSGLMAFMVAKLTH